MREGERKTREKEREKERGKKGILRYDNNLING